jgi:hypothetical protein
VVEGDGSVYWNAPEVVYYDFGALKSYRSISKIGLMLKCDVTGNLIECSLAETLPEGYSYGDYSEGAYSFNTIIDTDLYTDSCPINIKNANVWQYIEIPTTKNFRYLGFKRIAGKTSTNVIRVDDIRVYGYFQKVYEGNVISLDYEIGKNNDRLYDAEIGTYNPLVNDALFRMEEKIRALGG